jgi:ABC-2 type transport system ATP-binding protein
VRRLVKSYGSRRAVDEVSWSLAAGRLLALLGTNGAGKTTTIETCEGFRRPDAGSVRVLGLDPIADARALRPRVGVMLQDGVGGYTAARALELLELFAGYARHPLHPRWLLERVGLSEVARTPVKRLSGGEQQRLSLALALVGRPELVFLDEPTTGMDPHARRTTWDLIRLLRSDGVTVVLTTHYLDEAEELADDVIVMNAGRIVAQGSPSELTRGGADGRITFTAPPGLPLADLVAALPGSARAQETAPGQYLITAQVTPDLLAAVTIWCAGRNVLAEGLNVGRRSLEEVFLTLTSTASAEAGAELETTPATSRRRAAR